MLRMVSRSRLESAIEDPAFLELYDGAIRGLEEARKAANTWWSRRFPDLADCSIGYFSAEFAIHQSLPIYAGGLGVLAGDHSKEASDLGVPLIGVGFMYPQGYFHQRVTSEGRQIEEYEHLNWGNTPVQHALMPDGRPCIIAVQVADRLVSVRVWLVQLGRVKLFLLDTDVEGNTPWDRELSARFYGGDRETRLKQEIVLGVGGVRALGALGLQPTLWHLNEGHAAFVVLERMRVFVEHGSTFPEALQAVRSTTIFTTHTPVPAGHDAFAFQLVENHLHPLWDGLGVHRHNFLELGNYSGGGEAMFNMTALALRTAGAVNAVSRSHRKVTSAMWASIWPADSNREPPVRAVTNGVHIATWIAPVVSDLFDRYLGPDWRERQDDTGLWDGVLSIPDEELWAARQALRAYLLAFVRERARERWVQQSVSFTHSQTLPKTSRTPNALAALSPTRCGPFSFRFSVST